MNMKNILNTARVSRHLPACLCLISLAIAQASPIFVSPSGNNSNPGTLGSPVQTLARAIQLAGNGDVIVLRAGTYTETLNLNQNSPQNLTFRAHENENPVLVVNPATPVTVQNATGMKFERIEFRNGGMVISGGSSNISLDSCVFTDSNSYAALNIENAQNVVVESSRFVNSRGTNVILLTGTCDEILIRGNEFVNVYSPDAGVQAAVFLSGQTPAESILVENNLFTWTTDQSTRPIIAPGNSVAAIWIENSNGTSFTQPRIVFRNNRIENLRFRGTNDDRDYNPAYLKTPAQGGEQGNAFSVLFSSHIAIENNVVFNVSAYGVNGFMVDHLRIERNLFQEVGINGVFLVGDAVTKTGAAPNLISDNRIFDGGWLKGGSSGISTIFPGPGNLILRNFVSGQRNGVAGTVGADWYGDGNGILADLDSAGTLIIGNVVVHNEGAGISMNRSSNSVVIHNTVIGNGSMPHRSDNAGILIAGGAGPSDNILMVNNLVYNNRLAQFWVWMTALNHQVRFNLFAPGPLTVPSRQSQVIDWFGSLFTVPQWIANPPVAGNGAGTLGQRPVFLGDLIGGDPRKDLFFYLPVNGSPGTAGAQARSALSAIGLPAIFANENALSRAIAPAGQPLMNRPSTSANLGALEPQSAIVQGWLGAVTISQPTPNASQVFSNRLQQSLEFQNGMTFVPRLGTLQPLGQDDWLISSRFGFLYAGNETFQTAGWLWSERFGWMKFESGFLWANHLQTWLEVRPDGTFFSFDFGPLVPVAGQIHRYNSRIGMLTAREQTPPGWLESDRFGFVWFARDGSRVWFWSANRQEWIGILPDGSLWSTAESRFI